MAAEEDGVLRIVISTDNHLGYKERDPIRGMDSFAAFEEVLCFSKWKGADMLLLGGDVFHDNKPSRRTMHQTYDLLREYVLGHEPVAFQIMSDQKEAFEGRRGQVNYEDPHYAVGLPVFAIHGNHDDPTREGGNDALAALDLLSVTNFVNYFGKAEKVDDVTIKPILIRKGSTNVALYGLGNIRDERLNRMWTKHKVKFLRPSESEGRDSFYNILVLHQNRAEGRGRKNAIFESMIPEWFDVVVWGHEHECQTQFHESLHGRFRVLQPGSTVATSLVDGESQPKHLAVLEIKGQQFRLQSYRLKQVRPFVTEEVRLDDEEFGLNPEDVKVESEIDAVLEETVRNLVTRARREREGVLEDQAGEGPPANKLCTMQHPNQVLVRVKVDRLGFSTLNNQRFGARFVGDVANPGDILLFHQRRRDAAAAGGGDSAGGKAKGARSHALNTPVAPDDGEDLSVEDLVANQLQTSDKKLRLLTEINLKDALEKYVEKQQTTAINELVERTLEETQDKLNSSEYRGATTVALIHDAVDEFQPSQSQATQGLPSQSAMGSQASSSSSTQLSGTQASSASSSSSSYAPSSNRRRQAGTAQNSKRGGLSTIESGSEDEVGVLDDHDDEVFDVDEDDNAASSKRNAGAKKKTMPPPAAAVTSSKRTRAPTSKKRSTAGNDDDGDEEEADFDDDEEADDGDAFDSEEEEVAPPKKKGRAAPVPRTKTKAAAALKKTPAPRGKASSGSSSSSSSSSRKLPGWATGSNVSGSSQRSNAKHAADDWA